MGKLTNFRSCTGSDAGLYWQEIDVVVEVITELIKSDGNPSAGTFILDGQKKGEKPQCLVRFNLENGRVLERRYTVKHKPVKPDTSEVFADSDTMAEESIDRFLQMPSYEKYCFFYYPQHEYRNKSGIYVDGMYKVLCLNTAEGRFLCSFYADYENGGHEQSTRVLMCVSEVIARLDRSDWVLQESNRTIWQEESEHQPELTCLGQWISDLFEKCELPALETRRVLDEFDAFL
jgi:hypothetical protein